MPQPQTIWWPNGSLSEGSPPVRIYCHPVNTLVSSFDCCTDCSGDSDQSLMFVSQARVDNDHCVERWSVEWSQDSLDLNREGCVAWERVVHRHRLAWQVWWKMLNLLRIDMKDVERSILWINDCGQLMSCLQYVNRGCQLASVMKVEKT